MIAVLVMFLFGVFLIGLGVYLSNRSLIEGAPLVDVAKAQSRQSVFSPAIKIPPAELENIRKFADSLKTTAVIAIQNNRLIVEWGKTDKRISGHSVRKSLVSALYGVAFQKGLIDTNSTLADLGVDDKNPPLSPQEKQARIVDLLKSKSGVYRNSVKADMEEGRPERHAHAPGTFFFYNNWSFNALGGIFERVTALKLGEAFKEWIAEPIGMQDFRIEDVRYTYSEESDFPAYRFWISARDLARFGMLFLNDGAWGGKQIISRDWVSASTATYSEAGRFGYGFMWWTIGDGSYMASGTGGQKLLVDPNRKLVVVNRVDTGEPGLRRGLWWNYGPRVRNRQFRGLTNRIADLTSSIE